MLEIINVMFNILNNNIKKTEVTMNELIKKCPKCNHYLHISEYSCSECDTKIKGEFKIYESNGDNHNIFNKLSEEDSYFILVFLQTGGVIQNVEKVMGISYPTVKAKLHEIQLKLSGEIHDQHHDRYFDKKAFKREMRQFKHNLRRHIRANVHHGRKHGFAIKMDLDMDPDDDHDSIAYETTEAGPRLGPDFATEPSESKDSGTGRKLSDILDKLDSGELDVAETMDKIKGLKNK